jgi:glycosyltransferase involved in cell wall biosynthesis
MKILFLPNFNVNQVSSMNNQYYEANQFIDIEKYWFFKYWDNVEIEIYNPSKYKPFNFMEFKSKIYLHQQLKSIINLRKFDIIISHSYISGSIVSFFRSMVNMHHPPHIIVDVGCINGCVDNPLQIKILKKALNNIDGIIYHSSINEIFYDKYLQNVRRQFVYYGENPDYIKPFDYQSSNDFVLSFGYSKRDYKTLIKAWTDHQIKIPLKIIGLDKTRDFNNIIIQKKVGFNELLHNIHNSRFVILPIENCKYSVGQMSLIQSMAMNKTVVVSNVHGIRDYVESGINSISYNDGSSEDLFNSINPLIDDNIITQKIGENARNDVINKFNQKNMSIKMYNFVKKIVNNG